MSRLGRVLLQGKLLAGSLVGKSVFEGPHYRESELTRLVNLFAHVDLERWKGLRVLEVGSGHGRIGDAFAQLGFQVTSSDGRAENVERIRERGREARVLDLERVEPDDLAGHAVVVAFGVLYHLSDPLPFLRAAGRTASVLLLETVVMDSPEPVLRQVREAGGKRGVDQALGGTGCRPSPSWVENAVREAGFTRVRDISTALANWGIGRFDWEARGTGEWKRDGVNFRKMWVCEKNGSGPGP